MTSALASRRTSITIRIPSRSVSSLTSVIPSISLFRPVQQSANQVSGNHVRNFVNNDSRYRSFALQYQQRTMICPGLIGFPDTGFTHNDPTSREVRTRESLHQFRNRYVRVLHQHVDGADDFTEVVGGNIRRHPDGNPGSPVDQEVREAGRQDNGFLFSPIVVWLKSTVSLLMSRHFTAILLIRARYTAWQPHYHRRPTGLP